MNIETVNFYLDSNADMDSVWEHLIYFGCELLYSNEDEFEKVIVGRLPQNMTKELLLENVPELKDVKESFLAHIDWEAQWAAYGVGYSEGYVHVDLHDYISPEVIINPTKLQLKAGPGFGDLSHPTTRQVLKLMARFVSNKHVIDVGSGSGILSLAACAMGASVVEGIDIDPAAIEHAQANSLLNGMDKRITFFLSEDYELPNGNCPQVLLMNMIQSEQKQAWESLPMIHCGPQAITSGILKEEREAYLAVTKSWGWQLVEEAEEDGWLAFHFISHNQ